MSNANCLPSSEKSNLKQLRQLVEVKLVQCNNASSSPNPNVSAENSCETATVEQSKNLEDLPKPRFAVPLRRNDASSTDINHLPSSANSVRIIDVIDLEECDDAPSSPNPNVSAENSCETSPVEHSKNVENLPKPLLFSVPWPFQGISSKAMTNCNNGTHASSTDVNHSSSVNSVELVDVEAEQCNDAPSSSNPNVSSGNSCKSSTVERSQNVKSLFSAPLPREFNFGSVIPPGNFCESSTVERPENLEQPKSLFSLHWPFEKCCLSTLSNHESNLITDPNCPEKRLEPDESSAEPLISETPKNSRKRKRKRPPKHRGSANVLSDDNSSIPDKKLEQAESEIETSIVDSNNPEKKLEPAESNTKILISDSVEMTIDDHGTDALSNHKDPNVSSGNSCESSTVQRLQNVESLFSAPLPREFTFRSVTPAGNSRESSTVERSGNLEQPKSHWPFEKYCLRKEITIGNHGTDALSNHEINLITDPNCPEKRLEPDETKANILVSESISSVSNNSEKKRKRTRKRKTNVLSNDSIIDSNNPEKKLKPAETSISDTPNNTAKKKKKKKKKHKWLEPKVDAVFLDSLNNPENNYQRSAYGVEPQSGYNVPFSSLKSSVVDSNNPGYRNDEKSVCEVEPLFGYNIPFSSSESSTVDSYNPGNRNDEKSACEVEPLFGYNIPFSSFESSTVFSNNPEYRNNGKLFAREAGKLFERYFPSSSITSSTETLFGYNFSSSSFESSTAGSINAGNKNNKKLSASKTEKLPAIDPYAASNPGNKKNKKLSASKSEKLPAIDPYAASNPGNKKNKKLSASKIEKLPATDSNAPKMMKELHKHQNPNIKGHICETVFFRFYSINENRQMPREEQLNAVKGIAKLVKCQLPSCYLKSDLEPDDIPSIEKYEWENLVDNEFVRRLDDNVKRTVDSILIPEDECKRVLNEVIKDLNDAFCVKATPAVINHWQCIGHYSYGLVFSDTKIILSYESLPLKRVSKNLRQKLEASLLSSKNFNVIQEEQDQREHICAIHLKTEKKIQILFSRTIDVRRSLLMKLYLGMNPNLKYFFVYVKLLLEKFCKRMYSSFVSTPLDFWLVVFFMQRRNLLPAVINVRRFATARLDVSGWNCSLPEEYYCLTEPISLYSLLLGFINFYKNFDFWNYVICPYLGDVLVISDLERLKIPADEFSAYLKNVQDPNQDAFKRYFLNLQDPTDLSLNIGKSFDGLNEFEEMCHRLSELLPKRIADIERVDCICHILPDVLERKEYNPRNFIKYAVLLKNLKFIYNNPTKLCQNHFLEAVRKLMEVVFRFEQKSIVIFRDCIRTACNGQSKKTSRATVPVIYFEYCSSEDTWQSDYMRRNFPRDGVEERIRINLRCEIFLEKNEIDIACAGNARFLKFLKTHFIMMIQIVLREIT